jgi:ABC-type Mn2+/Zn2+ transport system ATPase subunit
MIAIQNLRVCKNGSSICRVAELVIRPGELVAVVGGNGSGKTTLLRVVAGLERDYAGTCEVGTARKGRIYVHQAPYLFRGTVLDNTMYGLRAHGRSPTQARQEALGWLEQLGIGQLADRPTGGLSGGERRKITLARAIAPRPQLLLLDEPLAELDEAGAADVMNALSQLQQTTILIASPTALPKTPAAHDYRTVLMEQMTSV